MYTRKGASPDPQDQKKSQIATGQRVERNTRSTSRQWRRPVTRLECDCEEAMPRFQPDKMRDCEGEVIVLGWVTYQIDPLARSQSPLP